MTIVRLFATTQFHSLQHKRSDILISLLWLNIIETKFAIFLSNFPFAIQGRARANLPKIIYLQYCNFKSHSSAGFHLLMPLISDTKRKKSAGEPTMMDSCERVEMHAIWVNLQYNKVQKASGGTRMFHGWIFIALVKRIQSKR